MLARCVQNVCCVVASPCFREDQELLARDASFLEDVAVLVARHLQALAALPDTHAPVWSNDMQHTCIVLCWPPLAQHVAGLPLCHRLLRLLLLGLLRQLHGKLSAASQPSSKLVVATVNAMTAACTLCRGLDSRLGAAAISGAAEAGAGAVTAAPPAVVAAAATAEDAEAVGLALELVPLATNVVMLLPDASQHCSQPLPEAELTRYRKKLVSAWVDACAAAAAAAAQQRLAAQLPAHFAGATLSATTALVRAVGLPGLADYIPGGAARMLQLGRAAGAMSCAAVLHMASSWSAPMIDSHLRLLAELVATTTKLAYTLPPAPPGSLVPPLPLPLPLFAMPCAAIHGIMGAANQLGAEVWMPSACR